MSNRHGALEDLLVVDLTRVLSGPYCTSILADFGARVIKIERPETGDDSRFFGPYVEGESAYYANANRNKEGITLNMKTPEGKRILLELIKKADILVENFRPGVMEKMGMGYESLKEINPRLIYVEISGFGSYGRYCQRPGYDLLAQAMGGMMSITGPEGGDDCRAGSCIADVAAGMNGAMGALAAVHARTLTGKGQKVDISLLDSVVALLENYMIRYRHSGEIPGQVGNASPASYPFDSFRAGDGSFVLTCGNQKLFNTFALQVAEKPEWLLDERFCDNAARVANEPAMKEEIEKWAAAHEVDDIVERCLSKGIPAAPIRNLAQVASDPGIAEDRDMFPLMQHPVLGEERVNGWVCKMSDTPQSIYKPSPLLGQDTEAVLKEFLNLDEETINVLKNNKVI